MFHRRELCINSEAGPGDCPSLRQFRVTRCQFRYHEGKFDCGQIKILVVMNDIRAGDGATMVIPGNHKSNIRLPEFDQAEMSTAATSVEGVTGACEVHPAAGDA